MTLRKSKRSLLTSSKARRKRHKLHTQERLRRELQLETLEDRRLLAVQLAGILANDGSLLKNNEVRTAAPSELVFKFNENANLDPNSLSGIEITRSGGDGQFESATATTDFNTNGAVVMRFNAAQPGQSGNGVSLVFTRSNHGGADAPTISVSGNTVTVDLNTNAGNQTTAFDLREALTNDAAARRVVEAQIVRGNAFVDIATPPTTYSPLTLRGANAAKATTNFNVGNSLEVRFSAVNAGVSGNGIRVTFSKTDLGAAGAPRVTVNNRVVNIQMNSNAGNQSTALDVVSAVNNDPVASALIRAEIAFGNPLTNVAIQPVPASLTLRGANDLTVDAGYLAVGDSGNELIFRPAERLVDDVYNITILGVGANALQDQNGEVFLDGEGNFQLAFELDLGAQVISVVPQPVRRLANGTLTQLRDEVHVYFNDDDLDVASAQNPAFYQLIFTNDTVRNTDDVVYLPESVTYDAAADRAVLKFASPLDALGSGPGTFRLRIGTNEATPLAPNTFDATAIDAGSSFTTALDLSPQLDTGPVLVVNDDGTGFQDGQQIKITDNSGVTRTFEFENTLQGPAGTGGNAPIQFSPSLTPDFIATAIANAINGSAGFGVTAAANGNRVFLTGDVNVEIGAGVRIAKASQGVVVSGTISNDGQEYELQFPGDIEEPGHRLVRIQNHFGAPADSVSGISTIFYNFQDAYGVDTLGNVLHNAITEVQKERAREIFEIFSNYLGVNFVESQFRGLTIATGDLRAINPLIPSGPGAPSGLNDPFTGRVVVDLQDFQNTGDDQFGEGWFRTAMEHIGHLLGIGSSDELPPLNVVGNTELEPAMNVGEPVEPVFPGDHDLVHGRHVLRPEGKDIDLYKFEVIESGRFTAETIAERGVNPSLLDTVLTLYREDASGNRELIARNDDSFSEDSYLELELEPGIYYVGVTASGNTAFDPTIEDTGLGGRSEGNYELLLHFSGEADHSIIDADNSSSSGVGDGIAKATRLDGDADGRPGGVHDFWFRAQTLADTIFVDKAASSVGANGSLSRPFPTIPLGLAFAQPGDIVRIVGNGGADNDVTTLQDNLAYEIGINRLGAVMVDGANLEVPKGVTVMVDSNAVLKLRRARISAGSSTPVIDRSAGAFQVLGTPNVLDSTGAVRRDEFNQVIPGSVYFTSLHDRQIGRGVNSDASAPVAKEGDWGGIVLRNDLDAADQNRFNYEQEGIFLNYVNNANMQFGGGNVLIHGQSQVVTPVHMIGSRATVTQNTITNSADAALSATPNTALETNFTTPEYQLPGRFTPDYKRVGPEIQGNRLTDNSLNGLFIRVRTPSGNTLEPLTVSARWDDTDVVHVVQENFVIQGTPGGPVLETIAPPTQLVTVNPGPVGGSLVQGTYNYRLVFVDAAGNEGPPSNITRDVTIEGNPNLLGNPGVGTIRLGNLPTLANFPGFVARRIYRSNPLGAGPYELVAQINATATTYTDDGTTVGGQLAEFTDEVRARFDARLAIDPGTIVKLERSMFDVQKDAQFIAEGVDGTEVVITSLRDTRYGAGGTFNTNDQSATVFPTPGDWAGIVAGHGSSLSLEHTVVAFGGGVTRVDGDFRGFNTVEIHQADARIAHSVFEFNANGIPTGGDPESLENRFGRGYNRPGTVFVRGSQPTIAANKFTMNRGPVINIDVNSLNTNLVEDQGGSMGEANIIPGSEGNFGPWVRGNQIANNDVNGMVIRGGALLTQSVWDDTDMVHVVNDTITVPDFHTFGGLRLQSDATESLVVKFNGATAGVTATGTPLDIDDRIGGMVHVVGAPGNPVVLTSAFDCSVGAGFEPDGDPQVDTLNTGACGGGPTTTDFVDVIVVIDESGSMFAAQQFTAGLMQSLDAALIAQGIGDGSKGINQFGLVGYGGGGAGNEGRSVPVGAGGALFGTSTEYAAATANLFTSGAIEDGYAGLQFAIDNYNFRPNATPFVLLVTDEDRDIVNANLTFNSILAGLNSERVILDGILDVDIRDAMGNQALAIDAANNVFIADGSGGFTTEPGGSIQERFFNNSLGDYGNMAFATGGIVGDIFQIQFGGPRTTSFGNAMVTSIVAQAGGGAGSPGDWRSIRLEAYSHDRNVELVTELESDRVASPGTNSLAGNAQFLGALAPNEKAGDENRRLGFEVHGQLAARNDVDVYSFEANAGTEVWLDIDRTTHSLDTVVEVIDADNNVIARSNNSFDEAEDPSLLFNSNQIPSRHVNVLQKSIYEGQDRWSTNPRDAGMRVVLPGAANTTSTYYVRVRSAGTDITDVSGGLTKGVYQLQIRLREVDEFPGSTVRQSDIRFATNGIEVLGQPIHSPLMGEIAEDASTNNTAANAQNIGNLLETDRATLAIAGRLDNATDVDFYEFEIQYALPNALSHLATIFDIDYADGLGRANTQINVFDATGNLVLTSKASNIAEDRPGPLQGNGISDLSRGSVGALDPFIGTQELPSGTYFVAVSSSQVPVELEQFTSANPNNPLLRLEPIDSLNRIVEDHIAGSGGSTANAPIVPNFAGGGNIIPFNLDDVVLFVSRDPGLLNQTDIHTVDPFSGTQETRIGRFGFDVGDIDLRANGELRAFSLDLEQAPFTDADAGDYIWISTENGAVLAVDDGNIETYEFDPQDPNNAVRSNPVGGNRLGDGIHFQALEITPFGDRERGFAVGSRPFGANPLGVDDTENILYEFDPNTGDAFSAPANDRTGNNRRFGAGTQIVERGRLLTDADPFGLVGKVIIASEATEVDINFQTNPQILDGTAFAVDDGTGSLTNFEFVSGPEINFSLTPFAPTNPMFIRDGDTFFLDGTPFEFDTGEVFVVTAANGNFINDGDRFTVTDNQPTPVTRTFEFDNGTGPVLSGNVIPVPFNVGMTRAALVSAIVTAINSQTAFDANGNPIYAASAQALPTADNNFNNRISLLNSSSAAAPAAGLTVEGNSGQSVSRAVPNPPGTVLIPIEEVSLNDELGTSLLVTFNGTPGPPAQPGVAGITVGARGQRANFLGPGFGNFTELVNRGVFTDLGHDDQAPVGVTGIPFLADDTASEIATRITAAINSTAGLSASSNNEIVTLAGAATFDSADEPPLRIAGAAPGGEITGLASLNGALYAVSDAGGLFRVFNPTSPGGAVLDYIETSTDLLGLDLQGLTPGPPNAEGGAFANLMFTIDSDGTLYAINTAGELQPIFVDAQTSVETGLTNVHGLTFSNLDFNLWHTSTSRGDEAGHGLNPAFDGSRPGTPGGTSFWFGWESAQANGFLDNLLNNPFNAADNSANRNYKFPGGAHGEIESNRFSLRGYSAADQPVLYFNYRLDTENANADLNTPELMRDAFRVYLQDDQGQWHLVATNNSDRGPGFLDDEFDNWTGFGPVQELYDIGDNGAPNSWRQARVPLDFFAGQDDLRIRFEFSSAAQITLGNPSVAGDDLLAPLGNELRDGQSFTVDGTDVFEFDLGPTVVTATGAAIVDGETLTIDGRIFEFDSDGTLSDPMHIAVAYNDQQSASAVALELARVVGATSFLTTADLLTSEANDTLANAVDSGLTGGAGLFRATGQIGDNPNFPTNPGIDVDLVRLQLNTNNTIRVQANTPNSALNPLLRIFDAAGNELAVNDDTNGVDAEITITVPTAGTYYVGVSSSPNDSYDPNAAGSGIAGSSGEYELEISINDFSGVTPHLHENRVQLEGAVRVTQSATPANVIDGAAGVATGATRVAVHSDMTRTEVAEQYRQALADVYSGGDISIMKSRGEVVTLIGHSVTDAGPIRLANNLTGDQFGAFFASDPNPGAQRGQDNDHEGVYVDDIIIGFAERGEMATGSNGATGFITDPLLPANQILVGEYDLEIRRAAQYGISLFPDLLLTRGFDTNDRFTQQQTLVAPRAHEVIDGQTFALSDGVDTVTFEFDDVNIGDGVAPGNIRIPFDPSAAIVTGGIEAERDFDLAKRIRDAINSNPVQAVLEITAGLADGEITGTFSTDNRINLYGNVIVGSTLSTPLPVDLSETPTPNDISVNAADPGIQPGTSARVTGSGQIGDNPNLVGFNSTLDVDLIELNLTAGSRLTIDIDADENGSTLDSMIRVFDVAGNQIALSDDAPAPGEVFSLDSYLDIQIPATGRYYVGVSAFANSSYTIDTEASGAGGFSTGPYDIEINVEASGIATVVYDDVGDKNHFRDQGQMLIHSNKITRSSQFGIVVDAALRDGPEGNPHQAPVRNLRELNTRRLVPGVVVENNLVVQNAQGGIRVSGDVNGANQQLASVPFSRIINNTLFGSGGTLVGGGGGDTGLVIDNNASPTVLNNIFANFQQGIQVDASSTPVFGGSLFQGNGTNSNVGLGDTPIVVADTEAVFVDPVTGNFYLAPGSRAIDSSTNSLVDRQALVTVRNPLGIPQSPVKAPSRDLIGQLRVDDPDVEPASGSGSNVFVDRGAIDRADFVGPSALLIDPQDNDARGLDQDGRVTFVELTADALFGFSIQLVDGLEPEDPQNGVGVNDASVSSEQVVLRQDGRVLVEGVDYKFRYDSLNNIIRLTPLAGIWPTNHQYTIELANRDQFVLTAPDGLSVLDGDIFQITDQDGNSSTFEFESGFSLQVAPTFALQIPAAGGGLGGVTDRQSIVIGDGAQTITLEFDNNGNVAGGSIPVVFTPASSADAIAQALVDAIRTANADLNVPLAPLALGNGLVHLGTQTGVHSVDLTNAPRITSTGTLGGGVADGETFMVDDGTTAVTFEFDFDGTLNDTDNRAILLAHSNTHEVIAAQIIAAVEAATTLDLTDLGDGTVHVGGDRVTQLDTANSNLTQAGQPGVAPEFGIQIPTLGGLPQGIQDGQTFRIGDGISLPVRFEFDDDGNFVPGNTIISFNDTSTVDQIANSIVVAVASVGLGLNPTNTGDGIIELNNDSFGHFFDAGTSPLTQRGVPGVAGNIPVPFLPSDTFTVDQMATAITVAINSSSELVGVTANPRGGEVVLDGASSVAGIVDTFIEGIRDLAGNILKPNQTTGETIFTIQLGSGFDYGDAPASFNGGGYPTFAADNGAAHEVDPSFRLGATIDVDVDGQPNATATGDGSDDGVAFEDFIRGHSTRIDVTVAGVTATKPGFLDAWIDLNRDGDWNDPGEQIASSLSVVNGVNSITVSLPTNLPTGTTYARFRLSSTGGLGPAGAAADGEVEDYAVELKASNWQNGAFPEDTSGDGVITAFDVLHSVTFLQTVVQPFGTFQLPKEPTLSLPDGRVISAPPFVDVNGDRFVTPQDVVLVVNFLLRQNAGTPEGEGSSAASFAAEGEAAGSTAWGITETATPFALPGVDPPTYSMLGSSSDDAQPATRQAGSQPVREISFRLPRTNLGGRAVSDWLPSFAVEESSDLDDVLDSLSGQSSADDHDAFFAAFGDE